MQHCGNYCDCVYSKGFEIILPAALSVRVLLLY